jgi:cell volume regulation protein A
MTEPFATGLLLAVLGVLLAIAVLTSPASTRFGVPALVVFVGLGVLAGSEGLGGIPFDDYDLAFRLGSIALALILFDGGLNTSGVVFRRAATRGTLLATVAVLATAAVVTGVGWGLGLGLPTAVLVGAVVSSTDAAAVFATLRSSGVRLKQSTAATLEVESGLNDPMAMFLTIAATEFVVGGASAPVDLVSLFALQMGVGLAFGVAIGHLAWLLLRTVKLPAAGLYPVLTGSAACLSFGGATLLGGSGFLSVYLTALWLADRPIPYRSGVRRVHDALATLSQVVMFLMLGLLVFPSRLAPTAGIGLVLALALAFLARPVGVYLALALSRIPWRERVFTGWVGLRGAVPIVLATYPALRGVPAGDEVFHLVFFVVLVNAFVPGATVGWAAHRLGLSSAPQPTPAATIELMSSGDLGGEFVWYYVSPAAMAAGASLRELELPESCLVTLVMRESEMVAPRGGTTLEVGDHVCVFLTAENRTLLDLLFGGEAGGEA